MEIDKKQLKEVLAYTSHKIYCDIHNINYETSINILKKYGKIA